MASAYTIHKLFSRTTKVTIKIDAPINLVWEVLCNIDSYSSWNSTVIMAKGECRVGAKVEIITTLAPTKKFSLKIKKLEPLSKLVMGNAMGTRKIELERGETYTLFSMTETLKGPLLPLFARYIPSFDESFDEFSRSLKNCCETCLND